MLLTVILYSLTWENT